MNAKVKPIPEGFHTVTPYLIAKNASEAIDFYKRAFGAKERYRLPMPDGKIGHAEVTIGNSIVMVSDECAEHGSFSPQTLNGSCVGFALYVEDADKAFQKAVHAGATIKEALENKFWGDRCGTVMDPFGHKWMILTHVEDVSPADMKSRMEKMFAEPAGQHA